MPAIGERNLWQLTKFDYFGLLSRLMSGFLQGFSNVGEELGVKVGLKHKKINISNPRVSRCLWSSAN